MPKKEPLALRFSRPTTLPQHLQTRLGQPQKQNQSPVLLLHGTVDSPGAWLTLAQALFEAGYNVFTPSYGNRGTAPLVQSVREIADYAAQILATTGSDCLDIVGHSQGGAIAYDILDDPRLTGKINTVVSISGTVHGISWPRQLRWIGMGRRWLARTVAGDALVDQLVRYSACCPVTGGMIRQSEHIQHVGKPGPRYWVNLLSHSDGIVGAQSAAQDRDFINPQSCSDTAEAAGSDERPVKTEVTTIWMDDAIGRPIAHWQQQGDADVAQLVIELLDAHKRRQAECG